MTGNLCPSHKLSYLKLIPKSGKDTRKLTNWRPITLSNCDHKIITKTYAGRLGSRMATCIKERQTAYIKGRIINDNIRAILGSVCTANQEDAIDGLVVSLDAKKAFDSVDHKYIEKCLMNFGLGTFVPIFRILYKDLQTDVMINGQIVKGFKIKRGVKQGDALSCILFIMCIEPLLNNIENNPNIESIRSVKLGTELPKAYAYADDVSCVIKNNLGSVQGVFDEYGRLTRQSGLELNAEKTEILRFKSGQQLPNEIKLDVRYNGANYEVKTMNKVKINGIYFQQNQTVMREDNVEAALRRVDSQLRRWSTRRLCLLGKILILKTFGISQLIYLMQSIELKPSDFKRINAILYRFLWNRNYLAAKAPDRIKREIINTAVKQGGFGMLNIVDMDKGIKLKALGRLMESLHPYMGVIRTKVRLENFFFPKVDTLIDCMTSAAVDMLGIERRKTWEAPVESLEVNALKLIKEIRIQDCVNAVGRNSIGYFNLRIAGLLKIGDLNLNQLRVVERFIDRNLVNKCRELIPLNLNQQRPVMDHCKLIFLGNKLVDLTTLSSKVIRQGLGCREPICLFNSGLLLNPSEALNWANKVSKLTSVKHRNFLLRIAHKELYTKEKLHRYGLIDSPLCPRCDQIETFEHRIFRCEYAKRIWDEVLTKSRRLNIGGQPPNGDMLFNILGGGVENSVTTLTLHAEVIMRILSIPDDSSYLLRPQKFVENAVKLLIRREKEPQKDLLKTLY